MGDVAPLPPLPPTVERAYDYSAFVNQPFPASPIETDYDALFDWTSTARAWMVAVNTNVSSFVQGVEAANEAADRAEAAADLVTSRGYPTRAALLAAIADGMTVPPGNIVVAEGLHYRSVSGATAIADMPGYLPIDATLRHWGCAGNGTADDTARIGQAIAAGLPLSGEGLIYGVSATIDLISGSTLRDATFRRLNPAEGTAVITLRALGADRVTLERVKVDRNGDGSNGGQALPPNGLMDTCVGILIEGGQHHMLVDLEVFGNDSGTGIRFVSLDETSRVIRPYAHDMMSQVPGATDDCTQGISFQLCVGLTVYSPRAERLSWRPDAGTPAIYDNSRGVVYSGCEYCQIFGTVTEDSGQGQDLSGNLGNGNRFNRLIGGVFRRHATWGLKFANLARGNIIIGAVAEECGSAGFVDSASFDDFIDDGDANRIVLCRTLNCGKATGSSAGFLKLAGSRPFTNLVHFDRCVAVDRRSPALMQFGYRCEPAGRAAAMARATACMSIGHTNTAKSGFSDDRVVITNVGSQSAPGVETYVRGSAVVVPPQSVFAQGGVYTFRTYVTKTAAGTGNPRVQVRFGAADTSATMLAEITLSPQTAAADRAVLEVVCVFRSTGAATLISAWAELRSNLGTGGFATRQVQTNAFSIASFNSIADGAAIGVVVNPTTGASWDFIGAHARLDLVGAGS